MSKRTVAMYVIAALVVGVVLGSFGIATAAPASTTGQQPGLGLKLGATFKAAKATMVDTVAKLTGKSVADVRKERAAGKSFAQIASASGVPSSKVVADTLAARKAMLASLVKQGKITQAQADAALARMTTRLNDRVNNTAACTGTGAGCGTGGACSMGGAGGGRGRMGGSGACGMGGGCTTPPTQ